MPTAYEMAKDFLLRVWGENTRPGDVVFLSLKSPSGDWRDVGLSVDEDLGDRVDSFLADIEPGQDAYFCPTPFTGGRRRKDKVRGSRFLWADLDEIDPDGLPHKPAILWESSPGRYQALWRVQDFLEPKKAEALSKAMAYKTGADKGGWDLTQVLRIPGTANNKYPEKPVVKLLDYKVGKGYKLSALERKLARETETAETLGEVPRDPEAARAVLKRYRVPRKVLRLLWGKPVEGKRSDTLWYLEHKLHEAGLSAPEILAVIKCSPWNKYAGRRDEDHRLKTEIAKTLEEGFSIPDPRVDEDGEPRELIVLEPYGEVMGSLQANPGWAVKDFWLRRSYGIIAGEPKSFKSTLCLDFCVSVASGKPFLDAYEIESGGPVIYVQNENALWVMKDRLEKLIAAKGLAGAVRNTGRRNLSVTFPEDLPLYFVNQQSFLIDSEAYKDALEDLIDEVRPAFVVLDPLYLMFTGDINTAQDLAEPLQWLLRLRKEYGTGIILVHHWNKGGDSKRGGQRMLGSTTLHGWVESAWYLRPGLPGSSMVTMEREFRAAGSYPLLDIKVKMGDIGDATYGVDLQDHAATKELELEDNKEQVLAVLGTQSKRVSVKFLCDHLGLTRRKVQAAVDSLKTDGKLDINNGGILLQS